MTIAVGGLGKVSSCTRKLTNTGTLDSTAWLTGPKGEGIICNDCATEWNRLETLRKQDQKRPDSQATEMKPDDDAPKRHSLIWISTGDDDIDEVEEVQYIRPSTVVAMSSPAFDQSCFPRLCLRSLSSRVLTPGKIYIAIPCALL